MGVVVVYSFTYCRSGDSALLSAPFGDMKPKVNVETVSPLAELVTNSCMFSLLFLIRSRTFCNASFGFLFEIINLEK